MQKKEKTVYPDVFIGVPEIRVTLDKSKMSEAGNAAYIKALNDKGFWLGHYAGDNDRELWLVQGKLVLISFVKGEAVEIVERS